MTSKRFVGRALDVPGEGCFPSMAQLVWAAAFAAEARFHIMTGDHNEVNAATAAECAAIADGVVQLLGLVELQPSGERVKG